MQKLVFWKKKIQQQKFKKLSQLKQFLVNENFVPLKHSHGSSGKFQYVNKKHNVVIKHCYITKRKPKYCVVPTIRIPSLSDSYYQPKKNYVILIQYLCKPYKHIYWKSFQALASKLFIFGYEDVYRRNVGIYNKQLVLFDW